MTRDEKQLEIENDYVSIVKSGGVGGAIEACTGFGKTTCGLNICRRLKTDTKINVVVPTIELKSQWERGIREKNLVHNINVYVVNTFVNLTEDEKSCFFLVLDEAHRYSNEEAKLFSTVIDNTDFCSVLCLSATYSKEQLNFLESRGIKVFAKITMEEAAGKGWVSNFTQYNLGVKFTEQEKENYTKATNIMSAHAPYLEGLDVFNAGKDKQRLFYFCKENGLDYGDIQMRLARYTTSSSTRKGIVYNAANKIPIIKDIVTRVGKKSIVFSETKKFSEEAHKSMKDISVLYHSSLAGKAKTKALQDILKPDILAICAPKALDEGIDIPQLKCGIITSGTSVERQQVQRMGRVTRFVPNEHAIIVNLYAEDSIEEAWLKKRQKNMNNIRWITNVSQIVVQ
jgi:RNA polymerase primary sigma factor